MSAKQLAPCSTVTTASARSQQAAEGAGCALWTALPWQVLFGPSSRRPRPPSLPASSPL